MGYGQTPSIKTQSQGHPRQIGIVQVVTSTIIYYTNQLSLSKSSKLYSIIKLFDKLVRKTLTIHCYSNIYDNLAVQNTNTTKNKLNPLLKLV